MISFFTKLFRDLASIAQIWEAFEEYIMIALGHLKKPIDALVGVIIGFAISFGLVDGLKPVVRGPTDLEAASRERLLSECTIDAPKAIAKKNLPYADYSTLVAEREKCMRERNYVRRNTKE